MSFIARVGPGGRIRTSDRRFIGAPHDLAVLHRGGAARRGLEPRSPESGSGVSADLTNGHRRLPEEAPSCERSAGIEPASPVWKTGASAEFTTTACVFHQLWSCQRTGARTDGRSRTHLAAVLEAAPLPKLIGKEKNGDERTPNRESRPFRFPGGRLP